MADGENGNADRESGDRQRKGTARSVHGSRTRWI